MSIDFSGLWPTWAILLIAAAVCAALVHGTLGMLRKNVPGRLVGILALLRLAILALFVLIVCQPVITYATTGEQLPELMVLVDTSRSMSQSAANGQGSRLDEALAALRKGPFAEALRGRFERNWYAFDGTAAPVAEVELGGLKAEGATTQIAESIAAACAQLRALGKKPERLLLVSDGNDLGNSDPAEMARGLGLSIDVLALGTAPTADKPGLEITDVQTARRVLLGSETHFRLTLTGSLPRAQAFTLRMAEDGRNILEQKRQWKAGETEQTVLLAHRPAGTGLKQYALEVELADRSKTGRPYRVGVQVVDSKYEILVLEDTWRWEYKFLHRLFEDDPSFRFSALLARGNGAFVQYGSPDRRVNLIGFPQNRSDLEGFDTFFLGDVKPTRWPRGVPATLARQVVDEGKALVVIAGPNLANLADVPELEAILPVELGTGAGKPVEGPIEVRLRSDSSQSPFFFQVRTGAAEKLPPLDQIYPVLRKRAGATVLLEAVKNRNSYGNLIVMAEHTVGRGRVLFVGTDTLWKWQTLAAANDGPTPYSIFWQQAFRALTPAKSSLGPVSLWLTPSRTRGEVGRSMVLLAEIQSEHALPHGSLQGTVLLPDDKRLPLVFSADPAQPRHFRADFTPPARGPYRLSAEFLVEGKSVAQATTAVEIEEARGEESDRGVDAVSLARIAAASGGQVIDPARSETWPAASERALATVARFQTIDLWNNFTLLLILCALLGTDWFLRMFKGLV